jgi:hypothetical protein
VLVLCEPVADLTWIPLGERLEKRRCRNDVIATLGGIRGKCVVAKNGGFENGKLLGAQVSGCVAEHERTAFLTSLSIFEGLVIGPLESFASCRWKLCTMEYHKMILLKSDDYPTKGRMPEGLTGKKRTSIHWALIGGRLSQN